MKISKPQISRNVDHTLYSVDVESKEGSGPLWYEVPNSFGDFLSANCDAALVALLIPAMANGEDIQVDGAISEELYFKISGPLQHVLQLVIPSLQKVEVFPQSLCAGDADQAKGVATGFSGGIDSYCLLADHLFSEIPDSFKITHLLFNNVGSHGKGGERLFRERYDRLVPAAERLGLPFLKVNSNLDSFYSKKLNFQQTHTMRNFSVPLVLQNGIGRYLYASAYSYSDVFVGPSKDLAYTDSIVLPLLSTEWVDGLSVGSEHTRVAKTLRVAELSDSYQALDVCVSSRSASSYTNCGSCWKCLRTLATLDIAGYLDRYSEAFDLNAYKAHKSEYFRTLRGSEDPLLIEVVRLADELGYPLPGSGLGESSLVSSRTKGFYRRMAEKLKG